MLATFLPSYLCTSPSISSAGQLGDMCWAGFLSLGIPLQGGGRGLPRAGRREKGPSGLHQPGACYITGVACSRGWELLSGGASGVSGEDTGVDGCPTGHRGLAGFHPPLSVRLPRLLHT